MAKDILQHYHQGGPRLLMIDYDGTLSDFADTPEGAAPTPQILEILTALASDPANTVVVVSGRDQPTMESWLGHLPITLSAEHGLFLRLLGADWQTTRPIDHYWKPPIQDLMRDVLIPGSELEDKEMSLVWHFRLADPAVAALAAEWLLSVLIEPAQSLDLKVMSGHQIVEVTASGTDKGQAARTLMKQAKYKFILAAGDDTTDDDLFRALPKDAHIVKVGDPSPLATHSVADPEGLRSLLTSLCQ